MSLDVLYRDSHLIAVSKPPGLLVHRGRGPEEQDALIQRLRNQIGARVFPVHRLDRPTSGVVVLALDKETHRRLSEMFQQRRVEKSYLAVTRGFAPDSGELDYAVRDEDGRSRDAVTRWRRLETAVLPFAVGRYAEARVSLVEVMPETGRYHQIRKHFAHLRHPLIGDTKHGEGRWNRLFREHLNCHRLLLHAWTLAFDHPDGRRVVIRASPDARLLELFTRLGWILENNDLDVL